MYFIEVPEHIADRLDEYPTSVRGSRLEKAINRALDASGWPGVIDAESMASDHWYVTIWNRRGKLLGHVGPVAGRTQADRVEASWRRDGYGARTSRAQVGNPLTNALVS